MIAISVLLWSGVCMADPASATDVVIEPVVISALEVIEVSAGESGLLESFMVREGQWVEAGQELAQLDRRLVVQQLARVRTEQTIAEAQASSQVGIEIAKRTRALAQTELARARESNEKYPRSVTQTELDRLQLTVERAAFQVEQACRERQIAEWTRTLRDTDVEIARLQVQRRTVVAPQRGLVVQVFQRRGEWVTPERPLLRLLRLDRLRAEGFVDSRRFGLEIKDARVLVQAVIPQRGATEFHGRVSFASPEVDPVDHRFRIWAEIDNPELLLRPGQNVRMTLHASGTAAPHAPRQEKSK